MMHDLVHMVPLWQWFMCWVVLLPIAFVVGAFYDPDKMARKIDRAWIRYEQMHHERIVNVLANWCRLYSQDRDRGIGATLQGMLDAQHLREIKEWNKILNSLH